MTSLAILFAGFSLFSALALAFTHFSAEAYREQPLARAMGISLLAALAALQTAHFAWLDLDLPWTASTPYRMALFVVAPAFYLFSRPLLHPEARVQSRQQPPAHFLPVLLAPFLPDGIALPTAFLVGAGYLAWLASSMYALRATRAGFQRELKLLGGVFGIAIAVAGFGIFQTSLPGKLFYSLYATAIGLAFLLVQLVLGRRPALSAEVSEAAHTAYAVSTLTQVDCDAAQARLENLMQERRYHDPDLGLATLAEEVALSPHQLSELLNARLGKSFARYLREWRVAAAREMLCAEPSASVLSVGLNVGFTSQSNFYEAFREIEGMTPGQYRKLHCLAKNG